MLYGVALAAAGGGGLSVPGAVGSFFVTVLGGVLCGGLVCGAVLLLVGRTDDHLVEITFSTVAAYGSFLLAEHFHLSGVLATMTAGVMIGNLGSLGEFSDRGRDAAVSFWEYAGFVANSLIFLLIGIRLVLQKAEGVLPMASVVILLVLAGRAVAVYACCGCFRGVALAGDGGAPAHPFLGRTARRAWPSRWRWACPPMSRNVRRSSRSRSSWWRSRWSCRGLTMTPLLRWLGELGPSAPPPASGERAEARTSR